LKRNKLVSEIDECHRIALASKFELEQATVESERRLDVANLECDVIESDQARFSCLGHETPPVSKR
jgi:hypothetical protein